MALSGDSKLKEVLENEEAVAILEEYLPGITSNAQLKMAYSMGLRVVLSFPQVPIDDDQLEELIGKIEAL